MTDVQLTEEKTQNVAGISDNGEQYVAPRHYSTSYYEQVINTAEFYEVIPARSNKQFVITSMLIATSKTFGSATVAETVMIWETSPADFSTNLKTIAQIDFLKNDRLPISGLNLLVTEARSVVVSAADTNVDVTLAGYYIDSVDGDG